LWEIFGLEIAGYLVVCVDLAWTWIQCLWIRLESVDLAGFYAGSGRIGTFWIRCTFSNALAIILCCYMQSNQLVVVDEASDDQVTGVVTQSDVLQYLISIKS